MGILDSFLPQDADTRSALGSSLGALGLSLASSPSNAPFSGLPQAFAIMGRNEKSGMSKSALKGLLLQAGYSDAEADRYSASEGTAKLALDAKKEAGFNSLVDSTLGSGAGAAAGGTGGASGVPSMSPAAPGGPAAGASMNGGLAPPSGDSAAIQTKFVDSLKAGGLTNAFGLGAVAAYGQHESRYSPGNVNRTWSDPSERGEAGTSGGLLSWRGDRLASMKAATNGAADPVDAQARFLLSENPALTQKLQAAKSPEEANALMAEAWKFAGYNRPGGEYAARLATTRSYAQQFAGSQGGQPVQVADASGGVPIPAVTRAPLRAPAGLPVRGVAENEEQTRIMEGRTGMCPPSVYGVTPEAQAGGAVAQANPADLPAPAAQEAGFEIPAGQGAQPAPAASPTSQFGAATVGAARQRMQAEVDRAVAAIAKSGAYGDRGARLADALKLKIAPLQKYLEPTDIERTLVAAESASPEAAAIIRNSINDARPAAVQTFEYGNRNPGFREYEDRKATQSAARTEVKIDQRGETKFDEKFGEAGAKRWEGFLNLGEPAKSRISDITVLREASQNVGNLGKSADFRAAVGPYLDAAGVKIDKLDDIQVFNSMAQKLAPTLREPGSGSTSDVEFRGFLNSIGTLSNRPEARARILDSFEAAARNQLASSKIASDLSNKRITRQEAEDKIAALPDPLSAFREYQRSQRGAGAPAGAAGSGQGSTGEAPNAAGAAPVRQPTAADMNATDRAVTIRRAKEAIAKNPRIREQVLQRLRDAGMATDGF